MNTNIPKILTASAILAVVFIAGATDASAGGLCPVSRSYRAVQIYPRYTHDRHHRNRGYYWKKTCGLCYTQHHPRFCPHRVSRPYSSHTRGGKVHGKVVISF